MYISFQILIPLKLIFSSLSFRTSTTSVISHQLIPVSILQITECFFPTAYPGMQSTIILLLSQVIRQTRILTFILLNINELVLEVTGIKDDRWQRYCTLILCQCVDHYVKIKRYFFHSFLENMPRWSGGRKREYWARGPGFDSRVGQSVIRFSI